MNVGQNKQDIGAVGAIQAVAPYLDASKDMLKPVQFAVIGILKLLAVGDGKTKEMELYTADAFFSIIDIGYLLLLEKKKKKKSLQCHSNRYSRTIFRRRSLRQYQPA